MARKSLSIVWFSIEILEANSEEDRKMNTNPDVDKLLSQKDHPLDVEIRRVREIILSTDERVEEALKWSSPTFM
jgi:hypothetical protein